MAQDEVILVDDKGEPIGTRKNPLYIQTVSMPVETGEGDD